MKTVNKFILKSYLGPMFMTFFIVMFILLMQFLWKYIDELVGKGLPLKAIVELLFYATSTLIPMGLPLATLLAAIMTMGNLGENNELLALKAAGISLPKIIRPIFIVAVLISVSSFFLINNFVPFSFQKMGALLYDIRQQKQEIEFKDGIFFNSIDNISIRVGHQDRRTGRLNDVLIYDTRKYNVTTTTVADSGYIVLSKDKKYLIVTLFDGQTYETTRDYTWYDKPSLTHHIFQKQEGIIPLSGFSFERSDASIFGNNSQVKNLKELSYDIDSLKQVSAQAVDKFSRGFLIDYLYRRDPGIAYDSTYRKTDLDLSGKLDSLTPRERQGLYNFAISKGNELKQYLTFEQANTKDTLIDLYKMQVELHKKLSLPVSILIFFLIGAPLGAIIRKGGLGTPIVISVAFFVIYYIITITGEKMVKEGAWPPILGMWISTFILFPLAIFLTYKATNDSSLLNAEWYIIRIKKLQYFFRNLKTKLKSKITKYEHAESKRVAPQHD